MKCPKCDGVGFVPTNVFGINGAIKCDFCDGTGVFITNAVEPMTNEEWLRTEPTTKEIVNALCEMDKWIKAKMKGEIGSYNKYEKGGYFEEWLKEKHHEM